MKIESIFANKKGPDLLIKAIHWFSPIIWISYAFMAKDMALSADESVMERSDVDIRGDYSISLLALSAKKSGLLSTLAFGETGVKTR
jgi:beta-lactamase regulating signal transducer with metallopeptidase domain